MKTKKVATADLIIRDQRFIAMPSHCGFEGHLSAAQLGRVVFSCFDAKTCIFLEMCNSSGYEGSLDNYHNFVGDVLCLLNCGLCAGLVALGAH